MGWAYIRFNFLSLIICAYGYIMPSLEKEEKERIQMRNKWIARSGPCCYFPRAFLSSEEHRRAPGVGFKWDDSLHSQEDLRPRSLLASSALRGIKLPILWVRWYTSPIPPTQGFKQGHGCGTHPRLSVITDLLHHLLPQVQGPSLAYIHPHTWNMEQCRSLWTFVEWADEHADEGKKERRNE